jgi:hypothetical protein
VLQKGYSVAKSAVVPSLVHNELDLLAANAQLAMLSAVGSMLGAGVGGIALLVGPAAPTRVAMASYLLTFLLAWRVPTVLVAAARATAGEMAALRQKGIRAAAAAIGVFRAVVGFTTFLLAFEFRVCRSTLPAAPQAHRRASCGARTSWGVRPRRSGISAWSCWRWASVRS